MLLILFSSFRNVLTSWTSGKAVSAIIGFLFVSLSSEFLKNKLIITVVSSLVFLIPVLQFFTYFYLIKKPELVQITGRPPVLFKTRVNLIFEFYFVINPLLLNYFMIFLIDYFLVSLTSKYLMKNE